MSKASARRRHGAARKARTARRQPSRRQRIFWGKWLGWSAAGLFLLGIAALVIIGPGQSTEDPALTTLAQEVSGGQVRVITGSAHTVYHSTVPLPTATAPRADGKLTLVWFPGTWCTFCERMDPFVLATADRFTDRLVFVEKSVDHDRSAASRYGIRGTPTFVLVDAEGHEVARFHYQLNAANFAGVIEAALARTAG